jgi:hypothetical protein
MRISGWPRGWSALVSRSKAGAREVVAEVGTKVMRRLQIRGDDRIADVVDLRSGHFDEQSL